MLWVVWDRNLEDTCGTCMPVLPERPVMWPLKRVCFLIELSLPPVGASIHWPLNTSAAGYLMDSGCFCLRDLLYILGTKWAPWVLKDRQDPFLSAMLRLHKTLGRFHYRTDELGLSQVVWGKDPLPWCRPHVKFFCIGSVPTAAVPHPS